ncbi:MAG: EamA family transporter [Simkaniaceae bacterium]|nr:EamA family transporter [Simkaniaceae bacterium]
MSVFLVVLMYATWSSIFSLGKIALQYSPPVFLTGFRMLFAGILLVGFLAIRKPKSLKVGKKLIFPLIILSFFSIYITNILEFWGLQYLSAAKTCFIYGLSPFIAAILSYIHFKEKINGRKLFGMMIGFAGFIPVLLMQSGSEDLFSAFSFLSWPEIAIMGAAFFSIYGWVLLRMVVKDDAISPLLANGYSMLLGGTLALFHSTFVESWNPLPIASGQTSAFISIVLVITLVSNILCYNLYGYMLKKFTATFLSFMGLLSPVFASFSGWLIIGERPSWVIFASTGVVSLGLFVIYKAELKQGYIKTKTTGSEPVSA